MLTSEILVLAAVGIEAASMCYQTPVFGPSDSGNEPGPTIKKYRQAFFGATAVTEGRHSHNKGVRLALQKMGILKDPGWKRSDMLSL